MRLNSIEAVLANEILFPTTFNQIFVYAKYYLFGCFESFSIRTVNYKVASWLVKKTNLLYIIHAMFETKAKTTIGQLYKILNLFDYLALNINLLSMQ